MAGVSRIVKETGVKIEWPLFKEYTIGALVMVWTSDTSGKTEYHYMMVEVGDDKLQALCTWWLKLFELASKAKNWDAIVCDVWIDNTGRFIGNVQDGNERVGQDRGFRVAITFQDFVDQLNDAYSKDDDSYDEVYSELLTQADEFLSISIIEPEVTDKAKELHQKNPFKIYWAVSGGGSETANEQYEILW